MQSLNKIACFGFFTKKIFIIKKILIFHSAFIQMECDSTIIIFPEGSLHKELLLAAAHFSQQIWESIPDWDDTDPDDLLTN